MTVQHESHRDRVEAGIGFEWDLLPPLVGRPDEVEPGATDVRLRRTRSSHRGISKLTNVSRLWAYGVDQDFLDEICAMQALDSLYLERVTANDLSGMSKLVRLNHLSVIDATKVESLEWIPVHDGLESLALENLPRVRELEPLARLPAPRSLAVEGSMWTPMRVSTLQPLSLLTSLEALFLTNLRVADGSLEPLHALPRLQVLQCARFFAREEFRRLEQSRPGLRCQWFDGQWWPGYAPR
jgi:hypothetical protein